MRMTAYSPLAGNILWWAVSDTTWPTFTMLPVVIVLLLLTALVATDPSSTDGGEEG